MWRREPKTSFQSRNGVRQSESYAVLKREAFDPSDVAAYLPIDFLVLLCYNVRDAAGSLGLDRDKPASSRLFQT